LPKREIWAMLKKREKAMPRGMKKDKKSHAKGHKKKR
jgi:hypothetical protein